MNLFAFRFWFGSLISNEADVDRHEKCTKSTILEQRLLDKCSSLTETCGPQTCEKSIEITNGAIGQVSEQEIATVQPY